MRKFMQRTYLWSIPIALAWPLTQNMIYAMHFGRFSIDAFNSSLVFVPMGIISAIILIYLLDRAETMNQRICTIFGYLLATPFVYFGSLLSGILLTPLLGTLIYGATALTIGTMVGYVIGSLTQNRDLV